MNNLKNNFIIEIYNCKALIVLLLMGSMVISCKKQVPLFTLSDPGKTGIHFQNLLPVNDTSFDILDYLYYFNGGGVGIGDINNDGLTDIYFTSNLGSNKLYLNKGNFVFEDITAKAGVKGISDWNTGVTMADVNGDGLLDIYVCAVGNFKNLKGKNELYINNGDLTFTESAEAYGLAITAFSTQATFFDYDKDGDLDMFLVCHSVHSVESYKSASERKIGSPQSGDKLFINEQKDGKAHFREVTAEAGIYNSATGYGLNVIVGDFNNDNWDDIYVSNDFHENDYYYLNNRDGTFKETNETAFGHESRFSMGSDVADMNNDGWLDIITLDMLPKNEKVLKSSASDDPFDIYKYKMSYGYHTQYSRNCLQLNVGGGKYFSEVGLYSGIEATDWSWSPLAADFDNDGIKDLFITNGIVKRPNDLDYVKFTSDPAIFQSLEKGKTADKQAIDKMPSGKVANYIFQGQHDLRFVDKSKEWGFDEPTLSNGSAYADLDNDGDLDIIINNINGPAMVYKNNSREKNNQHFIDIQLTGSGFNTNGFGAKVIIKNKGAIQLNYLTASRGFLSASTKIIHFGLGPDANIDTLQVIWPSGKMQQLFNVKANQRLLINEENAVIERSSLLPVDSLGSGPLLFGNITSEMKVDWKHEENNFVDFNVQALIPHMVSTQGPKIAVGDINKDGLDDFFVCGARDQASALFIQNKDGTFKSQQQALFAEDATNEDVNALFFDANGDGYPDLYVACGGNEFWGKESALQDRLYINNGKGEFTKSNGLPLFYGNSSVAVTADFDKDGDMDIFVGGRVISKRYGDIPPSYLLINDGRGNFTVAPDNVAPGLSKIGLVTDAVWTDQNMDGWQDLVIVGEWMPVTLFSNNNGKLENKTVAAGLDKTTGLWLSVKAADIDDNGFPDLLVGNLGENSKLKASIDFPLQLYTGDMDVNGAADQVLAVAKEGKYYTFSNKEDLEKQFPAMIRKRYEGYSQMAGQTVAEIFGDQLNRMNKLSVNTLSSCLLRNSGKTYTVERMPDQVQWFPVFAWSVADFDGDGRKDILAAGNFYGVVPFEGRYDAGYGQVLINKNKGWSAPTPLQSGLKIDGEVRNIQLLKSNNNRVIYVAARNNEKLFFFETIKKKFQTERILNLKK
ncbi:MAG: VCBS repeat-containing protein [Ferruginibacter sp.]